MSFVYVKALTGLLGVISLILLTAIVVILIKRRKRGYNTSIWFTSRTQKSQDGNETNSKLITTELWIVIYSLVCWYPCFFPNISPQETYLAWISNLASGARLEPLPSCSPEISCRTGSISTSVQTIFRSSASKSLSSLWRWVTNPPLLHIIAWSTVKASPHTHACFLSDVLRGICSFIFRKLCVHMRVNKTKFGETVLWSINTWPTLYRKAKHTSLRGWLANQNHYGKLE